MKKLFKALAFVLMVTMIVQFAPVKVEASSDSPMIGEIKLFAGNFAPMGWAFCSGQLLNISEYDALYSLVGTTYGGDGVTTFGLPNLSDRVPIGAGLGAGLSQRYMGEVGGQNAVTLSLNQIPSHAHQVQNLKVETTGGGSIKADNTIGSASTLGNNVLAKGNRNERIYSSNASSAQISMKSGAIEFNKTYAVSNTLGATGGNAAHNNLAPSLGMNYIISLFGIYPTSDGGENYIGEIKMMAGSVIPSNYEICRGQTLQIDQNQALFSLLGTMYGGDGRTNFRLPDFQGRSPIGAGAGSGLTQRVNGEQGGVENVTLITQNLPNHVHTMPAITNSYSETAAINYASETANTPNPENNVLAKGTKNERIYSNNSSSNMKANEVSMSWSGTVQNSISTASVGGTQAHNNMMPYLGINYIICKSGIFPSRDGGGNSPFLGEVDMFAFNFAPGGYVSCDGQLNEIRVNTALFSLLGTMYAGDGRTNFGLPDLRGRYAIGAGNLFTIGETFGTETVELTTSEIPNHTHSLNYTATITGSGTIHATSEKGNTNTPVNNLLAKGFKNERIYSTNNPTQKLLDSVKLDFTVKISPTDANGNAMNIGVTAANGAYVGHENMKPFTAITFAIATQGIYPPRP